jgi:hypothetical protein
MTTIRCCQALAAGAALFAVLGACGLPMPGRGTRVIVRPRPRIEVTIRSLTGTWDAVAKTPAGIDVFVLTLRQTGDTVSGTLEARGRVLGSDPALPARLKVSGSFDLMLGRPTEGVLVRGRQDQRGDRLRAWVSGLSEQSIFVTFIRRQ